MSSMARMAQDGTEKVDNAPLAKSAKVQIRRNVLDAVGKPAKVFDAFAGSGLLWRAVWRDAEVYVGCDQKEFADERTMFVADNRRVLRCIDLAAFNIFDLDNYGAPWEQAWIIAARRPLKPGELLGMVLTEGNGINYKSNLVPLVVRKMAGISPAVVGLSHRREEVHARIFSGLCHRMNAKLVKQWRAYGKTGMAVAYIGIVFKGT